MNEKHKENTPAKKDTTTWSEVEAIGRNAASVGGVYPMKYSENAGCRCNSPSTETARMHYETRPFSPVARRLFNDSEEEVTVTNVIPAPEVMIISPPDLTSSSSSTSAGSKLKSKRAKKRDERRKMREKKRKLDLVDSSEEDKKDDVSDLKQVITQ